MDGLALLCTLHADGPATLKRLRRAGCGNLGTLLERPAADLADVLDLTPAAARRMLREARLLAERVGPELELEESHEGLRGSASEAVLPQPSALDQRDRDLVASIRRPRIESVPEPAPAARHEPAPTECEEPEPAPASEPELRDVELRPTPSVASIDSVEPELRPAEPEPEPALAPPDEVVESSAVSVAALASVDGIDADLARDLAGLGIDSISALAEVDALLLRRELGVTFAQAKRLTFLARRARESEPEPPQELTLGATPQPEVEFAPRTAQAAIEAPPAPAPAPESTTDVPRWSAPIAPSQDLAPRPAAPKVAPEPVQSESVAGPTLEPEVDSDGPPQARTQERPQGRPQERPKFWEPRAYLAAEAERTAEVQGEVVDPAEITRPRRFWESRQAARARGTATPPAQAAAEGRSDSAPASEAGTTLGWDWSLGDVTPPESEAPPTGATAWEPLRPRDESDDSSAGPFA